MRKGNIRRAVLTIGAVMALSACGGTDGAPDGGAGRGEQSETAGQTGAWDGSSGEAGERMGFSSSWRDSHRALDRSLEMAAVKENTVYGLYTDDKEIKAFSQDIPSGQILTEAELPDADYVRCMTTDGQGSVYVLGNSGEADRLWKIDGSGQVFSMPEFELEDLNQQYWNPIQGFFTDEKGFFYVWVETSTLAGEYYEDGEDNVFVVVDRIYVKDSEGRTLYYSQIPDFGENKLLQFYINTEGSPEILARDAEGMYIQELSERQEEALKVRINLSPEGEETGEPENPAAVFVGKDGMLYCQGNGLYRYDFEKQKAEKLLELSSFGIKSSGILYLGMTEDGIEIVDNYGEGSNSEYTLLEPKESEKKVLTLGTVSMLSQLEEAVTAFNRFHEDMRVEIVNYYEEQKDYDAGLERLKLDIIRNQAPDILDVSGIDYEILVNKGILADLYSCMDRDPECGRERMMPGILECFETNGCLYSIAPAFQLHTMWGSASVIRGRRGVSYQELTEILQENGKDINAVYGFSADEPVLTTLCTMEMSRFIDWDKGSCDFQSQSFRRILEFTREYKGETSEGSLLRKIEDGRILMTVGIISRAADCRLQREIYGGSIEFIGYPVLEGTGTTVSFTGSELALNARSKNQEGAWEFIRYFLLNRDLEKGFPQWGFPLVREYFDAAMDRAMEKNSVVDPETGEEYALPEAVYQDPDSFICVYEVSQEDVDAVKELIGRAEGKFRYYPRIQSIINEEAQAYFTGQKDLDAVAALIQNRVALYLQEQRN